MRPYTPRGPGKERRSVGSELTKTLVAVVLWKLEAQDSFHPAWLCVQQTGFLRRGPPRHFLRFVHLGAQSPFT